MDEMTRTEDGWKGSAVRGLLYFVPDMIFKLFSDTSYFAERGGICAFKEQDELYAHILMNSPKDVEDVVLPNVPDLGSKVNEFYKLEEEDKGQKLLF